MKQGVAKNTIYLTLAYIGQKIFSFIFFTLIARYVGVENTGAYVFSFSFTSFFAIFADLGLSSVLIRETARDIKETEKLIRSVVTIKMLLATGSAILVFITLPFLHKSADVNLMVYVATVIMVLDTFTSSFWGIFRGWQNLKFESITVFVTQILIVTAGVSAILAHLPMVFLVGSVALGSVFQFTTSQILIRRRLKLRLRPVWDPATFARLFAIAIPFALSGIFTRFYSYLDQILISVLAGDKALGLYSVPYKITFALQFVPAAFGAALFPAMSDYFANSLDRLKHTFEKSIFYLMMASVPVAVGIAALAQPIITRIYGQAYGPSVLALRIMMISLPFVFLNFPVGALLNAGNRQTRQTINLAMTLVANAVLNLILIPRYSFIGSSIALVVSMAILFFSGLYWAGTIIKYHKQFLIDSFLAVLFSSGVMGFFVWLMKDLLGHTSRVSFIYQLVFLPVFGGILYFVLLMFIGGFKKSDLTDIKNSITRR